MENLENRIVKQEMINDLWISTVFLGIDHNWMPDGKPLLFEIMVFWEYEKPVTKTYKLPSKVIHTYRMDREEIDELTERYSTWEEAEAGHERIVKEARKRFIAINGN